MVRMIEEGVSEKKIHLKKEVRERTAGYIASALGLVAGLAWNDAIKTFIEAFFPLAKDTVPAKFLYAVLITIVVVLVTVYIVRFIEGGEKNN